MPYLISNGAVMSLTMEGRHENQQVMTVLHYKLRCGLPLVDGRAELETFLDSVNGVGKLVEKWKDCLSVKCVALRLRAQWLTPLRFAYVPRATVPGDGTIAGDAYPVNTAVAITRQTDVAGRDEVGTIHMPAVPITFIENGTLTPAAEAAYSLLAEKLIEVIPGGPDDVFFDPVHFKRANPSVANPIISYVLQPTARIMRRRTVGLGA